MSATTQLGKVMVTPKGAWNINNSYEVLDIVEDSGNGYIALQDVPANTQISDTSYWLKFAAKGENGNSIVSIEKTDTSGNVDTYTITLSDDTSYTFTVTNGSVTSVNGRTGDVTGLAEEDDIADLHNNVSELQSYVNGKYLIENAKFMFKKSLGSGEGDIIDSNTTILIYKLNIKIGDSIGLSNYDNYKYSIKILRNGMWHDYLTPWQTYEVSFSTNETISIYARKSDGSNVNETDFANIKNLFYKHSQGSLTDYVESLKDAIYKTKFDNCYNSDKAFELPAGFGEFPIEVSLSKDGKKYGHNISPDDYIINGENNATYFVSANGNDNNDGLTEDTPFLTITKAISMTDVGTIIINAGKYWNGTHFNSDGTDKPLNIIGKGKVEFYSSALQNPFKITDSAYVENIIFNGGISALETVLSTELVCFNHCSFENSSTSNGLTAKGGHYITIYCSAINNMLDGFNYHSNTGSMPFVIEICCYGYLNGKRSNLVINNGSTIHEGGKIIRIGSSYELSRGSSIADADGAKSINIRVTASSTLAIEATNRNSNFASLNTSKIWLYDCASHGSPYDIIADSATIYTNKTYASESNPNDGTITRLN